MSPAVPRLEIHDVDEEADEKIYAPLFSPFSRRLHMALLMMIGFFCVQFMTISLSLTITCMVNSTAVAEEQKAQSTGFPLPSKLPTAFNISSSKQCASVSKDTPIIIDYGGSLVWGHKIQHLLFEGTFLGATFTALPAIFILQRCSIRIIVAFSLILYSLCATVVPYLAINFGSSYVFASRLIMGLGESFAHPAFSTLISNWFPITERSTAIALYTTGNQLASAGGIPLCAWFCGSRFGWQGVFYMSGLVGIIWVSVWIPTASNQPSKCKLMTKKERKYLNAHCYERHHTKEESKTIPYKTILTSAPFWAQLQAQFFTSMVAALLLLYLPSYFKEVLLLGIMENGFYTALPTFAMFIWKLAWSIFMDTCKAKGILSPTAAVKLSQCIANFGMAGAMACVALFVDCTNPLLALFLMTMIWCALGCTVSGCVTSMLSIAPRYASTIVPISTFFCQLGRLCAPVGVSFIKKTGSPAEWTLIFLYGGVCLIISGVLFLIFGSGDLQDWGKEETLNEQAREAQEWEWEMMIKERRHTASISIQ